MARDLDLAIIVRAVDRATGPLRRIQAQTDRLNEANRRMRRVATVAAAGLGAAGFAFKRYFIDTAAETERFMTLLETTEGSIEKARRSMSWIEEFGARTPFGISEVTQAFVRLRNYGLDPTSGLLRTLGDTAAAMGAPIVQAVEAIADAVTGENERLKELTGIKGRAVKGGKIRYEYTVDGETRFAEALASDRAGILSTLTGILDPRYGGVMEKQSTKFEGIVSNLLDQFEIFRRKVMESGAFEFLTKRLQALLDRINAMEKSGRLQEIADLVGNRILTALEKTEEAIKQILPWVERFGQALAWAAEKLGGWGNLAMALTGLYIARPFISLTGALRGVASWSGKALSGVTKLGKAAAAPAAATAPRGVAALAGVSGGLGAAPAAGAAGAAAGKVGLLARLGVMLKPLAAVAALLSIKFLAIGAAVAVVAGLVFKYWQPVKAFLIGVWTGFAEAFQPVAASFGQWLTPLVGWFKELLAPVSMSAEELAGFVSAGVAVGRVLGGLVGNIAQFVSGLVALPFRIIGAAASLGTALIDAIVSGVTSAGPKLVDAIWSLLSKVRDLLPFSDARTGPLSRLTGAGAAIVETMGRGVLRAGPGALQRPLARTLGTAAAGLALGAGAAGAGAAAAAPVTVNNYYQFTFHQQPGEDAQALAERVMREIQRTSRQSALEGQYDEL